ncbi:MAG: tripartite tricarboxylate transporter substrate binding protein [Burkholderiaceae bacterium]|nr:tripartite tricarboxylate transporter substrate binding protein [Burkholderiaceae bacterium]
MNRREAILGAVAGSLAMGPLAARAQSSDVAINVVAATPGGPSDTLARLLAPAASEALGLKIVIQNKAGAAGNIGTLDASRAAPDGRTVVSVGPNVVANPHLLKNAVDPLKGLTAITQLISVQYVLVVGKRMAAQNLSEFIRAAKESKTPLTYGSWGTGSNSHLCGVFLAQALGVKMIHVPYKGSAAAMTDVIGGQIDFFFDSAGTAISHVKAGSVRAIAVSSIWEEPNLPNVPMLSSVFPGYDMTGWQAVFGPPGLSMEWRKRWQLAIKAAFENEAVRKQVIANGYTPIASDPLDCEKFMRSEYDRFGELIRSENITPS